MIKIVLFGATENMYKAACEHLTSDCEIVAFCDNNEFKQGIIWNGRPILSINQLKSFDFDYLIAVDKYSYPTVRKQIINSGVADEKILPLLTLQNWQLFVEPINLIDESILKKLFKSDSKKLIAGLNELKIINELYNEVEPLKDFDLNFENYPLIAHASGGMINEEKIIYTNSKEAFDTSITNGYKMIEVDVFGELENDLLFAHDSSKLYNLATTNYHSLTFSYILKKLNENPQLKIMLDVKYNTFSDYQRLLAKMDSMMNEEFKKKFVVQTYDEVTTEYAVKNNWQCILMSYRNPQGSFFKKTAYLCCKYKLLGAIFNKTIILKSAKYIKFLSDKNVPILVYTVDDIEEVSQLKKLGVKSIVTNFLRVNEQ